METRYQYVLRFTLAINDVILINVCFFLAYYLFNNTVTGVGDNDYKQTVIICSLLWLVSGGVFKLYSAAVVKELKSIYAGTWQSITVHAVLFIGYFLVLDAKNIPVTFLLLFYTLLLIALVLSRYVGTGIQQILNDNYNIRKNVAVLSIKDGGLRLAAYLKKQSDINFAGFLEKLPGLANNKTTQPSTRQQLRAAAKAGIEEVFVSVNPEDLDGMTSLIREGEEECVRLKFVPDFNADAGLTMDFSQSLPILNSRVEPLEEMGNKFKKRVLDIVVSLLTIIFIMSWLLPLLALIIKIQSKGPVFFTQLRTGRDNKPFLCYKFRSMYVNDDSDKVQARANDPRVTPIGRFMRRTSLDEFPQFFNVLLGPMSIIGPRPHMIAHTEEYRRIVDRYMVRQFLKPGISGWAQVNGFRGETHEDEQMVQRVEHDLWYMENWSIGLDFRILFMTVLNVFKKEENAY